MRIGILGSGLMGGKLGTLFTQAGHDVVFSYSRSSKKLDRLASNAGERARAGSPREATQESELLLLAVHWSRVDEVLRLAGDLSGKVLVTCSLPMNADDTELVVAHTSSGAEALAQKAVGAKVVSAFGSVPSEVLFDVFGGKGNGAPPNMMYCGDDHDAKEIVAGLIREIGFEPTDVGGLDSARYIEPFTMLIAKLAYESDGGPEVAYRFEWLGRVSRER